MSRTHPDSADLVDATLDGAELARANPDPADLTGASLRHVDRKRTILGDATFRRTTMRDGSLNNRDW